MLTDLNYVMEEIKTALITDFNVWNIEVNLRRGGKMEMPEDGEMREIPGKKIEKLMCHSFSIGIDARIGLSFEQKRTRSRACNVLVYAWEGAKRFLDCGCSR